jgi:hypothetical protein
MTAGASCNKARREANDTAPQRPPGVAVCGHHQWEESLGDSCRSCEKAFMRATARQKVRAATSAAREREGEGGTAWLRIQHP